MTVEQLASDYKQLMAVTNYLAAALQNVDIYENYDGKDSRRYWCNHNCWLYPGEAIANVNASQIEISVAKFKELMQNIDSNSELKTLLKSKNI
jgi:hypothetical protein